MKQGRVLGIWALDFVLRAIFLHKRLDCFLIYGLLMISQLKCGTASTIGLLVQPPYYSYCKSVEHRTTSEQE